MSEPLRRSDPPGSILDADALSRLHALDRSGGGRLVERVLRTFADSSARLKEQLRSARPNGEAKSIFHVAHTLKSSSQSIGALRLAGLCAAIEAMIRADRLDGLEAAVDAMEAELEVVLQALNDMLNTSS